MRITLDAGGDELTVRWSEGGGGEEPAPPELAETAA
jgi:hypothetical protein